MVPKTRGHKENLHHEHRRRVFRPLFGPSVFAVPRRTSHRLRTRPGVPEDGQLLKISMVVALHFDSNGPALDALVV